MRPMQVTSLEEERRGREVINITIKEIRTEILKKSLEEMGEMLGITRQAYWLKETGQRELKSRELLEICRQAKVNPLEVKL